MVCVADWRRCCEVGLRYGLRWRIAGVAWGRPLLRRPKSWRWRGLVLVLRLRISVAHVAQGLACYDGCVDSTLRTKCDTESPRRPSKGNCSLIALSALSRQPPVCRRCYFIAAVSQRRRQCALALKGSQLTCRLFFSVNGKHMANDDRSPVEAHAG